MKILRSPPIPIWVSEGPERVQTTGHERDSESDWDFRGARYYSADYGRFLSVDPLSNHAPNWSGYNYVMGNPIKSIDPDGRWPWTPKWRKNARRLADRTQGEISERKNGSLSVDYYSQSEGAMYSVNFRKGVEHNDLFDNVGDPGYHFSDHASLDKQFGYWLENNFGGPSNEFGSQKGSVAEVVGQEIGAVVYQMYPGTIIAEILTGRSGPVPQTMVGDGVMYASIFVTPGGSISKGARGLWALTREGSVAIKSHRTFGNFYKSASDGLWWSADKAGHGGSKFKVFKETRKGLEWSHDADEFGDFILNKHKGDIGKFIPWDHLSNVK